MSCRIACLVGAALAFGVAPLIDAQPPASPPAKVNPAQVEQLVQQLSDGRFKVRAAALKGLQDLGADALPALRELAQRTTDVEARRRLEELLHGMEREAALEPTRVTMTVRNRTVREAVQELAKHSRYKIDLATANDEREKRTVSLDFKNTPFWEALDQLCEFCGLTYQEGFYGYPDEAIRLDFGESYPGIVHLNGPFRVSARYFDYYRKVDFTSRPRQIADAPMRRTETLSITLGIAVEPKLPLLHAGAPTLTEAVDDSGQSMLFPTEGRELGMRYYSGSYRSFLHQVQAQLQPTSGKKIKLIRGTIPVTVVSAQRPKIVVDKLLDVKNQTFKEGNTVLTIDSVTKNGRQVAVKMSIGEGAPNGQRDYAWLQSITNRLEVQDAKGNKFLPYGHSWGGGTNNTVEGTFTFGPNGPAEEAARLVYYEWTTLPHSVTFEFRDLLLP